MFSSQSEIQIATKDKLKQQGLTPYLAADLMGIFILPPAGLKRERHF
jgi:hypothetical protein